YTATVSPAPDGGTVAFTEGGTAVIRCGTTAVSSSGTATCQVSYASAGSHSITAAYSGDAAFPASSSDSLTQTVNKAATTTAATTAGSPPPAPPATTRQPVTFTATVSAKAPGGGTPTGQVTFADGGTTLGAATLDASGKATLDTSSLPGGGHFITASYGGD